jgi:predicted aldo/keto reductase-like oxidoreductase
MTPPESPRPSPGAGTLPRRPLGRTGHQVGLFSLGGQAALEAPDNEEQAVSIIERALDLGVNYLDTSPRYGRPDRWSERYVGQVMKRRRGGIYLASKTHERTRDASLRLLDESLEILNTDHLNAWQLHFVTTMDDVEQIFAKGGAIEALSQAREQGLVRNLGVTGHANPDVLIECLRRFPFDQILIAVNAADPHHLSFQERLVPLAVDRGIGIIGMKVTARGRILSSRAPASGDPTWTTPGTLSMGEALHYTLSLPISTVVIGCDTPAQVEENVRLARAFEPLDAARMHALARRTEAIARQALFFRPWD